jgi:hypothetical protein
MTARTPPAWHPECRRLRATGMSFAKIAKAIGRCEAVIRHCLNENGEQERKRDRDREYRREDRTDPQVKPFAGREVRQILVDPDAKRQALALFAAGKISRETLMARITAGAR